MEQMQIPPDIAARIMDRALTAGLDGVRATHGGRWSFIGRDPEGGRSWLASRQPRPGVWHYIATSTLAELARELDGEARRAPTE